MVDNDISIVILNYNDYETTINLYENIKNFNVINHIVIVDNCSTNDSFEKLKKCIDDKDVVIKTKYNKGYSYGNNFGIKYIMNNYNSSYIIVANPDVIFDEEVVIRMKEFMEANGNVGVVAPLMKNANGEFYFKCVWKIPTILEYIFTPTLVCKVLKHSYYYEKEVFENASSISVGCVAGSFLMIRACAMEKAGLYDENVFLYCEETILGLKMKKIGYESYLLKDINFVHMHSVSINKSIKLEQDRYKMLIQSRLYLLKEYYGLSNLALLIVKCIFQIDFRIRDILLSTKAR